MYIILHEGLDVSILRRCMPYYRLTEHYYCIASTALTFWTCVQTEQAINISDLFDNIHRIFCGIHTWQLQQCLAPSGRVTECSKPSSVLHCSVSPTCDDMMQLHSSLVGHAMQSFVVCMHMLSTTCNRQRRIHPALALSRAGSSICTIMEAFAA